MARDLRPRHREPHVREQAAGAPLADVALRLLVGRGRRGTDHVDPELRGVLRELRSRHERILP